MLNRVFQIVRPLALILLVATSGGSILELKLPRGLDFTLQNSPTPQKYLIETMPGGVALLDYNNDGLLDIFLVNGGRLTSPMQVPEKFDRANPRYWNRLYRQNKDGSFTDVTPKAGVAGGGWSVSADFFDYDNVVNLDLFVTRYMEWYTKHSKACGGAWRTYCPPAQFPATTNLLYRNRGDGTFEDVSQKS